MADYGGAYDPTLGFYGSGAAPPYMPTGAGASAFQYGGTAPITAPPAPFGAPSTNPNTFTPGPGFTNTSPVKASQPNGIPDPKNPGYDTAGWVLGATGTFATGTKVVNPTTGMTTTTGPNLSTISSAKTAATSAPPPGPGGGITDPRLYAPFTTPAPVFTKPPAFEAPTLDQAAAQPGYQFGLQQGEQALQQSAAAKGLLRSGGTLKGILDYGRNAATQNYANVLGQNLGIYNTNVATQYQQPFDNAFTTFIAEQNKFRANEQDPFNKYLELVKLSQQNA